MDISISPGTLLKPESLKNRASAPKNAELHKLRQSCREFESIYINEMYKTMRKSIPKSGLFKTDMADTLYQEMLDTEMAKKTAAGDGIGIGKAMYEQLKTQYSTKVKEE
jgi:flagellar protein FlgJ